MEQSQRTSMAIFQFSATGSVVLLALLMVSPDHVLKIGGFRPVPALAGIAGLILIAIALMTVDVISGPAEVRDEPDLDLRDLLPRVVEIALWVVAALYLFRLTEIARG